MDAQDNLKIIHTVDGASLQNRYGKSVIQSHDIGSSVCRQARFVMADPTLRFEIADFKRKAFQQRSVPVCIRCSHIPPILTGTAYLRLRRFVLQIGLQ